MASYPGSAEFKQIEEMLPSARSIADNDPRNPITSSLLISFSTLVDSVIAARMDGEGWFGDLGTLDLKGLPFAFTKILVEAFDEIENPESASDRLTKAHNDNYNDPDFRKRTLLFSLSLATDSLRALMAPATATYLGTAYRMNLRRDMVRSQYMDAIEYFSDHDEYGGAHQIAQAGIALSKAPGNDDLTFRRTLTQRSANLLVQIALEESKKKNPPNNKSSNGPMNGPSGI